MHSVLRHLFSLFVITAGMTALTHAQTYKAGLYQNAPKIYHDDRMTPRGFFPELLDVIAREEGFEVEYVPCEWSQCLEMLESGQIDLLPDVAYLPKRAKRFDFNDEPVISSWSVIYRSPNVTINTLPDLDLKRVVLLDGSAQTAAIREEAANYSIEPTFLYVKRFEEAFEMIRRGDADAAIVNRFYGALHQDQQVVRTDIVLQPAILKFAFTKGMHQSLIAAIDRRLQRFKADRASIYYGLKTTYLETRQETVIPEWLEELFGFLLSAMFVLALFVYLFRKRLEQKTQELEESMEALRQKDRLMLLQSRHATMGEMIAMIAHQWRQPLSIIGMTTTNLKIQQELNDRVDKRELTEALENIDEQVAHASKTIDIFRDFYRQQHEKAFVDINEVVDQSLRLVQRMIEKYGIAITFERSEEPAELKLLDKELVQVLINLLNNAKDALIRSEHSPKQITVSVNDQGDKVAISVCDNGEGIPDAIVSRIFDAYFTTKEDDQGTGIGLYMSRMIVEQHLEGTLRLEQGENTCFVITLTRTSKAD